jgi:hypothetical protein
MSQAVSDHIYLAEYTRLFLCIFPVITSCWGPFVKQLYAVTSQSLKHRSSDSYPLKSRITDLITCRDVSVTFPII